MAYPEVQHGYQRLQVARIHLQGAEKQTSRFRGAGPIQRTGLRHIEGESSIRRSLSFGTRFEDGRQSSLLRRCLRRPRLADAGESPLR